MMCVIYPAVGGVFLGKERKIQHHQTSQRSKTETCVGGHMCSLGSVGRQEKDALAPSAPRLHDNKDKPTGRMKHNRQKHEGNDIRESGPGWIRNHQVKVQIIACWHRMRTLHAEQRGKAKEKSAM